MVYVDLIHTYIYVFGSSYDFVAGKIIHTRASCLLYVIIWIKHTFHQHNKPPPFEPILMTKLAIRTVVP